MSQPTKKNGLFSKIESRADAEKTVRDGAMAFFFVAGLQGLLGVFLAPSMLFDAAILATLGVILKKWHSRVAAVLLLVVTGAQFGITLLNRVGATSLGGKNVILAVIMLIVAVRVVEATFKLHGSLRGTPAGERQPQARKVA